MKNKSIVLKLFFITTVVFTLFLAIQIGFQNMFFSKFYIKQKIRITERNIEEFSNKYLNSKWNEVDKTKEINRFKEENNSVIMITDEYGIPDYPNSISNYMNTMLISDDSGHIVKVFIDPIAEEQYGIEFSPKNGEEVYIEGIQVDNEEVIIEPLIIKMNGKTYLSSIVDYGVDDSNLKDYIDEFSNYENIKKMTGTIVYFQQKFNNDSIMYKEELLSSEIYSWFAENNDLNNINNDEIIRYDYVDSISAVKNKVFIKPLLKDGIKPKYIFVMTSLQPVNEAMSIMKNYYIYIFILALAFIIILSFIYSKMISKPLIKMNNVAKKMTDLDFSAYCEVKSEDEFGSLANNLNVLSKNLDYHMTELKKANTKLEEDIEKERKQDQIRKEFVASASHELKTPLGIIKGYAEGIKDGIYESKKEYYLDVIIDEIEKMNGLILEMLELSKLEAKACELKKDSFNIKDLIIRAEKKFKHSACCKSIEINLNIENFQVTGDKRKIEQVISNLFSNAIRYTENNGTVNIKIEEKSEEVFMYIENSRANISEEKLERIWDRFYRIDKSRSRALGGTGLGLPIVKNILELHGSDYGVRNTEIGVEFYFSMKKLK